ncbi:hypothetical protein K457DRAFT_445483 [Linnemannia elongata AG-77]|uniref:SURP motif domain-containing protein n=1 Tax=Linnemannia elongata AG-77 TaxID=1314771 RepID=A0A197K122_9FUNG|nr:hypothetical protein K457DRAFT_445483 [Linnemannia elongata AG-77]
MWNDPDLDSTRGQTAASGAPLNYRDRKANALKNELSAFGYEALLFKADSMAEAIEQGQWLITWQGEDPSSEYALWLDRYDVRNLLDDQRLYTGPREIHDNHFLNDSDELNEERFEDLDSDEELLFDMDEDERKDYLDRKQEQREGSSYKGVHYDYDGNQEDQVLEPTFHLHFDVPEGMAVPENEKTLALIERTAKFVNSSSESTMEIILQAKQAANPNFAFMSKRHHLFQFYKHIRWLMQTGLYEYAEEVRQREEEEARAEQEEQERKAAVLAEKELRLRLDLVKVVEKTIEFLKEHQNDPVYEKKLLSSTDIRFEFMKPGHVWHDYYMTRRREIFDSQIITHSESNAVLFTEQSATLSETEKRPTEDSVMGILEGTGVESTKETTFAAGHDTLQASLVSEPSSASNSSSRTDEMRRLDRLQRIKELFGQKQRKDSYERVEQVQVQALVPVQEQEEQGAVVTSDVEMTETVDVADNIVARHSTRSRSWSRSPPTTRSQSPDAFSLSLRKRTRLLQERDE